MDLACRSTPVDRSPCRIEHAGVASPSLVLGIAGIASNHPLNGLDQQRGNDIVHLVYEIPHVVIIVYRDLPLSQYRTGVEFSRQAVDGESHDRLTIPEHPIDGARPAEFRERRRVHVDRAQSW